MLAVYGVAATGAALGLRRWRNGVRPLTPMELVLFGLAADHLSRTITKGSITSVVRSPFTRFKEPAGASEVNEEVVGHGWRHAVGELLTCPFCMAQWVSTALIAGKIATPQFTAAAVSVCAVARVSDYLQLVYTRLKGDG